MDALDVVLIVEQGDLGDHTSEELLEGLQEHKETLRKLQGFWGRFIDALEKAGKI